MIPPNIQAKIEDLVKKKIVPEYSIIPKEVLEELEQFKLLDAEIRKIIDPIYEEFKDICNSPLDTPKVPYCKTEYNSQDPNYGAYVIWRRTGYKSIVAEGKTTIYNKQDNKIHKTTYHKYSLDQNQLPIEMDGPCRLWSEQYSGRFSSVYGSCRDREFCETLPVCFSEVDPSSKILMSNGYFKSLVYAKTKQGIATELVWNYSGPDYTDGEFMTPDSYQEKTGYKINNYSSSPHVAGRPENYKEKNAQPALTRLISHILIKRHDITKSSTINWTYCSAVSGAGNPKASDTIYVFEEDIVLSVVSPIDYPKFKNLIYHPTARNSPDSGNKTKFVTVVYTGEKDEMKLPHGQGKITYPDGRTIEGRFEHGKLKSGKLYFPLDEQNLRRRTEPRDLNASRSRQPHEHSRHNSDGHLQELRHCW